MASPSGTGGTAEREAPFLTVTTYEVWLRDGADREWQLWSARHVEQHHAEAVAAKVKHSPASLPTRETRVARSTLTVEWLDA